MKQKYTEAKSSSILKELETKFINTTWVILRIPVNWKLSSSPSWSFLFCWILRKGDMVWRLAGQGHSTFNISFSEGGAGVDGTDSAGSLFHILIVAGKKESWKASMEVANSLIFVGCPLEGRELRVMTPSLGFRSTRSWMTLYIITDLATFLRSERRGRSSRLTSSVALVVFFCHIKIITNKLLFNSRK